MGYDPSKHGAIQITDLYCDVNPSSKRASDIRSKKAGSYIGEGKNYIKVSATGYYCNCIESAPLSKHTEKYRLVNTDRDGICVDCRHYAVFVQNGQNIDWD